jgi:alpha-amylase
VRRNPDRIQVQLVREGLAMGVPLRITKGVTLEAGAAALEIAYLLEGIPPGAALNFAVEFNFAGMPSKAEGRNFRGGDGASLGDLGAQLDLSDQLELGLVDQWLGLDVRLAANRPTGFWTFPIETVSQSEGGYELVHQSVAVIPHWIVTGDASGRWSAVLRLTADTSLAENRARHPEFESVAT